MSREFPAVPAPTANLESHQATLVALKEAVEILLGDRGSSDNRAVLNSELEVVLTRLNNAGIP